MKYFEDLKVGDTWDPGSVSVSEDDILRFAEEFDPQSFHVDHDAAERNFGGLIASGWHTAALAMRPFAEHVLDDVAVVAAAGIEDLTWTEPVRPGDTLTVHAEVVDKDAWNDDRGLVSFQVTATNQDGERVHRRTDRVVVERRPN